MTGYALGGWGGNSVFNGVRVVWLLTLIKLVLP